VTTGTGAFPPINVLQQGSDFVAIIEMAGVSKDDLSVEVRGDTIPISGKKMVDYVVATPACIAESASPAWTDSRVPHILQGRLAWKPARKPEIDRPSSTAQANQIVH
jgi:hypothetical protein